MKRAYKYRVYPNKEQEDFLNKTIGCTRFLYNKMLEDRIRIYEEKSNEKNPTPAKYKEEFEFLKEVDSLALCNSSLNLDAAFNNFFREKGKVGFPKFKSKKKNSNSYTTNNQGSTIRIEDNKLKIPKLKSLIPIKLHREIKGIIRSATISQVPSGKYYVSILVEEDIQKLPKNDNQVGIDLGISDLAILSNGTKFPNPRYLKQSEKRLAFEQRKLSRMIIGSNNRNKQRIKVAKIHEKITNQRRDYLHNITSYLVKNFGFISLEDLSSTKLMKNKNISKAIADVSWFEFNRQLIYKSDWYGRKIVKVSKWFPSSQICSNCGTNTGKKPLNIREFTCTHCETTHDRDINASINILNEGKRISEVATTL